MATTGANEAPRASKKHEPWSRADRINSIGVIIALGVALGALVPMLNNAYQNHFDSPSAAITSLSDGQRIPNTRISVSGTSKHIPTDSDLWLTVSGPSDQVYPIAELPTNGKWNATEQQVCFRLGPGKQRLDVWAGPDTGDGEFVGYLQKNNTAGINSVPDGFVKKAQVTITIETPPGRC